jgi:hypothetical protein
VSPAIDKYSARIGVDRPEQRSQRIVQTDDENSRADRLQIFWYKPHPQLFARADDKNGDEQDDQIALEPKEVSQRSQAIHIRVSPRGQSDFQG